jgi:hypothetical protein
VLGRKVAKHQAPDSGDSGTAFTGAAVSVVVVRVSLA